MWQTLQTWSRHFNSDIHQKLDMHDWRVTWAFDVQDQKWVSNIALIVNTSTTYHNHAESIGSQNGGGPMCWVFPTKIIIWGVQVGYKTKWIPAPQVCQEKSSTSAIFVPLVTNTQQPSSPKEIWFTTINTIATNHELNPNPLSTQYQPIRNLGVWLTSLLTHIN